MNFTSSATTSSPVGFTQVPGFSNNTPGLAPIRQQPYQGTNRKQRREEAKILETREPEPTSRYISGPEMQKKAGRRAKQYFAEQRQNTAEQQSTSSPNGSFAGDKGAVAGPTCDHEHEGKLTNRSWFELATDVVSGKWGGRWMSPANEIKAPNAETRKKKTKETKETKVTKELARYADLVAQLRKNGVNKIFLAEGHFDPANLDMIGGATFGANQLEKEPMVLYREMLTHNDEEFDYVLAKLKDRNLLFEILLGQIQPGEATGPGVEMLRSAITSSERVEIKSMSFYNANRMDMDKSLKDKNFGLVSCGFGHAAFDLKPGDVLLFPASGLTTKNEYPAHSYSRKVLKDMWNGFERAQKIGPSALILQSELWDKDITKRDVYSYYNGKGLVVVELPLKQGVNATIIAPPSTLLMLQKFAEEHDGYVWIFCKGIEGCDTPPETEEEKPTAHDEF